MLSEGPQTRIDGITSDSPLHDVRARSTEDTVVVGASQAMRRVLGVVERIAPRDLTVLVTGETGTGKELIARLLHEKSPRRSGPFVRVNCSAIPPSLAESELFGHQRGAFTGAHKAHGGFFAMAHGGTLLLDEVESLPAEVQPKVLRTLADGEIQTIGQGGSRHVDVRVVACTNSRLDEGVKAGWFRADLYFRLAVVGIDLPPLRCRREDIAMLAEHFAAAAALRFGRGHVSLEPGLLATLAAMPWPGNVRQLEHTVTSMVALADGSVLDETLLPKDASELNTCPAGMTAPAQGATLNDRMDAVERRIILETLASCGDNRSETARRLGLRRTTLLDRMRRLGLRDETNTEPAHATVTELLVSPPRQRNAR